MNQISEEGRQTWVDVGKGLCIVLVVLMHSTLGVEKATGAATWLGSFVAWAAPFRMPDFFLISGLFLAARIDRPWRQYLDTKVVHFAYFYVLWLTIQFALKAPGMLAEGNAADLVGSYLWAFVDPFGTLWFIYLLMVYFIVAKLLHGVSKWLVLAAAALMHVAAPETGIFILDEFTSRFVFFFTGYAAAPLIFSLAERVGKLATLPIVAGLVVWGLVNSLGVSTGLAKIHGPDLVFSYVGIGAVIAFSVLVAMRGGMLGEALSYCGRNSIAIYLAFTVFMGPVRIVLLKLFDGAAPELVAISATAAGVIGSLVLQRALRGTALGFLFTRPALFKLGGQSKATVRPVAGVSMA